MRKFLGFSLAVLVLMVFATQVSAERRRRGGRQPAQEPIPHSDKIADVLGDIQWGWSHRKVISYATKKLREAFRPYLNKAPDAITEDRLRNDLNARIGRIKRSYVEFRGQRTGWDTSLVRDQYTHNNGEALVEVREIRPPGKLPRYTDYYFFINDHLWRLYRAFNQDQFEGIPFETAAKSFERRFGPAREKRQGGKLIGLEWQDDHTRLEAIDNTEFFGVFCLVFSDKDTERRLPQLRKNKAQKRDDVSPLVRSLQDAGERDRHRDIVEHLTGKRYNTAREQDSVGSPASGRGSKSRPAKRRGSNPFDRDEGRHEKHTGDPLQDLEI